jgi:hypothetical protein
LSVTPKGAGLTVIAGLVPVTDPEVAVNVTVPAATPVATPDAEIVATLVLDELHVTEFARFWVLPSEYVPVAVIWSVCPTMMDEAAAVTAMELKVRGAGWVIPPPLPPQDVSKTAAAHTNTTRITLRVLIPPSFPSPRIAIL